MAIKLIGIGYKASIEKSADIALLWNKNLENK
jgi:hypothetical protein